MKRAVFTRFDGHVKFRLFSSDNGIERGVGHGIFFTATSDGRAIAAEFDAYLISRGYDVTRLDKRA